MHFDQNVFCDGLYNNLARHKMRIKGDQIDPYFENGSSDPIQVWISRIFF